MKAYTIQDVARRAGVSVATVSRVINRSGPVKQQTRTKVERIIEEMEYQPNMLGRNLRQNRSGRILVLLPMFGAFYSMVNWGIQDFAHEQGYQVLVAQTYTEQGVVTGYMDMLSQHFVDGLICFDQRVPFEELEKLSARYPVAVNRVTPEGSNVPFASIDEYNSACVAVRHLISIGRKKIAIINRSVQFHFAHIRLDAYLDTLETEGLEIRPEWQRTVVTADNDGMPCCRELLRIENRPDAIFATSDKLAVDAIRAARELNIRVPEDLAVIGFDGDPLAQIYTPSISTIVQPQYQMGKQVCNILIDRIRGEITTSHRAMLDTELIVRNSTLST